MIRPAAQTLREREFVVRFAREFPHLSRALVSFFSVPTVSSIATSKIARISGAPVVPFFPLRLPDCSGYRLILQPALEDFPSGDPVADTEEFYRLLEQHIRRDPSQYYWLQPLVWGRPAGFPNTYEESTTLALLSTRVGLR